MFTYLLVCYLAVGCVLAYLCLSNKYYFTTARVVNHASAKNSCDFTTTRKQASLNKDSLTPKTTTKQQVTSVISLPNKGRSDKTQRVMSVISLPNKARSPKLQ